MTLSTFCCRVVRVDQLVRLARVADVGHARPRARLHAERADRRRARRSRTRASRRSPSCGAGRSSGPYGPRSYLALWVAPGEEESLDRSVRRTSARRRWGLARRLAGAAHPRRRVRLTAVVRTHNGALRTLSARPDDARPPHGTLVVRATEESGFLERRYRARAAVRGHHATRVPVQAPRRRAGAARRVARAAQERPRPVPLALVRDRHGDRRRRLGPARRRAGARAAVASSRSRSRPAS